jgi:D-glycero-D-manno-heptose 1,7-bisphosphate phosphatase
MLYLFDLDDTLIKSFLEEQTCPVCNGTRAKPGSLIPAGHGSGWNSLDPDPLDRGSYVPCESCRGRGTKLMHAENTYDEILWLPNRLETLDYLTGQGHDVAVVTNQTGVSYGYQTREQVTTKMEQVAAEVCCHAAYRPLVYACMDADDIIYRKPSPGMLRRAMNEFGATIPETVMVGDLPTDQQAARSAYVAFSWAEDFFREDDPCRH